MINKLLCNLAVSLTPDVGASGSIMNPRCTRTLKAAARLRKPAWGLEPIATSTIPCDRLCIPVLDEG